MRLRIWKLATPTLTGAAWLDRLGELLRVVGIDARMAPDDCILEVVHVDVGELQRIGELIAILAPFSTSSELRA